jgi:glycosyltransferase involved in cell wall biosynthesis
MMKSLGHEVYHYGAEASDESICTKHFNIITKVEQETYFKKNSHDFYPVDWSGKAAYWQSFTENAIREINSNKQPRDFVCLPSGMLSKPIADGVGSDVMSVEPFIGHESPFARWRVYASYALMHRFIGVGIPAEWNHVVIPHFFDPEELPLNLRPRLDHYLFVGRIIRFKGVRIAAQVCKAIGAKLLIAGQGVKSCRSGYLEAVDGEIYDGDIEYIGCLGPKERAFEMGRARAVFVASEYAEPFGNVAVESQFCGTPAITTDFGAFPETVEHGKTGYRCRTLDHFIFAAKNAHKLDPQYIHDRAVANYSMDRVKWMYQEYFQMLYDLWDKGWYTQRERTELDWLKKV